ncbi:MAG: DsrE family protein [Desulfocapsaceae bacterium]|nr:DsrE family protein [Desulfocapsaceae bacterium]
MNEKKHLYLLWTTESKISAEKMVFMYGINSKRRGWWEEVTIIIWGAPTLLAAQDTELQEKIEEAKLEGVHLSACKACADQLGVTDKLTDLGIEVIYWGDPLTKLLKNDEKLLTI